jgi:hypothetical protein
MMISFVALPLCPKFSYHWREGYTLYVEEPPKVDADGMEDGRPGAKPDSEKGDTGV